MDNLCKWCNDKPAKKTFCSHPCRNAWTSWNNKNNNPVWDESTRLKMANSLRGKKQSKETTAKRSKSLKKIFADDPTRAKRQVKAMHEKYTYKLSPGWEKTRKIVLERDKRTCQLCKKSNVRVVVHHKDHMGRNLPSYKMMNNDLDNLITLCYGCHISIHTWTVRRGREPLL